MLISNLRGYKNIFKNQKSLQQDLDKLLNEDSKVIGGKDGAKGFAFVVICFMSVVLIAFHIVVSTVISNPLVIAWAALMSLLTIKGFFQSIKVISSEKVPKLNKFSNINRPINTIYIIYFVYYVMFMI